jgi:Phage capsid family
MVLHGAMVLWQKVRYRTKVKTKLAALGDAYILGRSGTVLIPARNTTATVSGAFVAQGVPIPVKQGQFLPISLTMKKLAVITCMTREIVQHSVPAIEGILRTAMTNDTGVAIDTILLDTGAATAIRPVGLRNVTKVTASGTASIVGLIADLLNSGASLLTVMKSAASTNSTVSVVTLVDLRRGIPRSDPRDSWSANGKSPEPAACNSPAARASNGFIIQTGARRLPRALGDGNQEAHQWH